MGKRSTIMSTTIINDHNYIMLVILHVLLMMISLTIALQSGTLAKKAYDRLRLSNNETYYNGSVAAEHPRCSEIGVRIMEQGGSAVDAAISALLCVGVVNNFAAGIGGGGFMLVRDPSGKVEVIDFRETASRFAHQDMFNHNISLATESTLGVGVPGEIRGFATAHSCYGLLPWRMLFDPVIKLAREGFPVTAKMEDMITKFANRFEKSKGMKGTYLRSDGTPKRKGDFIFRPDLAKTLSIIAHDGPDSFYKGIIADNIVKTVESLQGGIDKHDLGQYQVLIRDPIEAEIGGFKLITAGVPTSGPLVIQILKVLEKMHLEGKPYDLANAQRMIEAFKFAYVDRMKLGDPDFVSGMNETIAKILSNDRIDQIISKIHDDMTFPPEYYMEEEPFSQSDSFGTTHLTSMDRSGLVASVTSTVNLEWGSGYMVDGIILNNELDDFSIPNTNNSFGLLPSEANYIAPKKRPLSSACPVILEKDGQVYLAIGGAGGSRIITAVTEMIMKLIFFKIEPDEAMESCRIHHQLLPDAVLVENTCERHLLRKLSHLGHTIVIIPKRSAGTSVNMIIRNPDGGMIPISDSRKGGLAAGF